MQDPEHETTALPLPHGRRSSGSNAGVALLRWLPVFAALGLLAQLSLYGLRPALAERARLDAAEDTVEARFEAVRDEFERKSAELEAWSDPVYRARQARMTRDAARYLATEGTGTEGTGTEGTGTEGTATGGTATGGDPGGVDAR